VRSLAWRSLKQVRTRDFEFLLYQRLCLDDLIPRLRDAGYATEAMLLDHFRSGLSRFELAGDTAG
jgi:hypothetical protein